MTAQFKRYRDGKPLQGRVVAQKTDEKVGPYFQIVAEGQVFYRTLKEVKIK